MASRWEGLGIDNQYVRTYFIVKLFAWSRSPRGLVASKDADAHRDPQDAGARGSRASTRRFSMAGVLGPLDGCTDELFGLTGITPSLRFHPFSRLKVLIMLEEVPHLLEHDHGQIG